MTKWARRLTLPGAALGALASPAGAQAPHAGHGGDAPAPAPDSVPHRSAPAAHAHAMWARPLGAGWRVVGMAQAFPAVTGADPLDQTRTLRTTQVYLTQPAAMVDLASPGQRVVLRTTVNLEAWTQPGGELTLGGWGEGFVDRRHPHTIVHELMASANVWRGAAGAAAWLSAGKGFVPYGTDDPMGRPVLKYPTNHHLSQLLERWTASAGLLTRRGLSLEGGVFAGAEPDGPYDWGNTHGFGRSWAARAAQRFGGGTGPNARWEASASYAHVDERVHAGGGATRLANAALRHSGAHRFGTLYALGEASRSWPDGERGYYSVLGEAGFGLGVRGRHQPYARLEFATRPEYAREGAPGTPGFFRYDHDAAHAIGATRWRIASLGYAYEHASARAALPASVRPFVEVQHHQVAAARGGVTPGVLFGTGSLWSASAGARIYLGGGPMRMRSYGTLDPMVGGMRSTTVGSAGHMGTHAGR